MHQRTELNWVARLAEAPSAISQYGSKRAICNAFLKPARASRDAMKVKRQRWRTGRCGRANYSQTVLADCCLGAFEKRSLDP